MANDIKIVVSIFVFAGLIIAGFFIYNKIYTRGYEQAHLECAEARQQYEQELQVKVTQLEDKLATTQQLANKKQQKLTKQILTISQQLKTEPVTIIKNGECLPSTNFLDSINQAIIKANER
jgi:vacuolar-type H+-ATPase subunit I/STV1